MTKLMLCNKTSYNLEHVKVTIKEAECVFMQVSVSSLLRNYDSAFYCNWMALLAPATSSATCQIVAIRTRNLFCPELSASCFKVLGTKQSHFLWLFAQSLSWIVGLVLSALGVHARLPLLRLSWGCSMWTVSLCLGFPWGMSRLLHCIWVFSVSHFKVFWKKIPSWLGFFLKTDPPSLGNFLGSTNEHALWTLPTSLAHKIQMPGIMSLLISCEVYWVKKTATVNQTLELSNSFFDFFWSEIE